MAVLTRTNEVPPAVATWFDRELLVRALPKLTFGRVAQRRPLPGKSGSTIIFRRFEPFTVSLTPITEGTASAGGTVTHTEVSVSIKQWGDWRALTDLVEAVVESPLLVEVTRLLAEQGGQTVDALMREAYSVGTNVFYGGNVAGRTQLVTITEKVDESILQRVIRGLARNNAAMYTDLIDATNNYNTTPIRPAYLAVTTPEVVFTLEKLSGWVPVEKYASTGPVMDAEVGAYRNIRFLQTTQGKALLGGNGANAASGDVKKTGNYADIHFIHVFGQDAVGTVPLSNMSFENIIHPKGSGGPADPMNQVGTSAWKRTGAELILNDAFMARIEVTVGDVAP